MKYFGTQDPDLHGDHLTWPGTADGFPVLGNYGGHLHQDEYEALALASTFNCDTFFTWDVESMVKFKQIMDYVHNGGFFVKKRMEQYDEEKKGWRLYVEWVQVYGLPPRDRDAIAHVVGSAAGATFSP